MQYPAALNQARLLRRYKRFLADVEWPNGARETVHCPNPGSMLGCADPGMRVWLGEGTNPRRKYRWSWELVECDTGALVGVHTGRTNALVGAAIDAGLLEPLAGYAERVAEFTPVAGGSRFDFRLDGAGRRPCLIEVKSVTASIEPGVAMFPDAVSKRAARHVTELAKALGAGYRAVVLLCAQRADVHAVRPAGEIDPAFAQALSAAAARGVEVLAYGCRVTPAGIDIDRRLRVQRLAHD